MKRIILSVCLIAFSQAAAASMVKCVGVIDSRTIVVDRNGVAENVRLEGVEVPPADELTARDYLQQHVAGAWVLIENGQVYRSPDALCINTALTHRAYFAPSLKVRYLGESFPAPRVRAQTPAPTTVRASTIPRRPHRRRR